jgi:hypothetical protein
MYGLALLALAALGVDSSDVSCAGDSCVAEAGVALLQHRHGSMKIDRVSGVTQDRMATCVDLARRADFTKTGYQIVKDSCCFDAMSEFIYLFAEYLEYAVCGPGFAPGLAKWHECTGNGTFEGLKESINDNALGKTIGGTRCSALRKKPQECTPRPEDCPNYSNFSNPPGCSCQKSKFVDLDFSKAKVTQNNLAGKGPKTEQEHEIRYSRIGQYDGKDFDLVVQKTDDSAYQTLDGKTGRNGVGPAEMNNKKISSSFGMINLARNSMVKLTFSFVSTDNDDVVELPDLAFTVLDLSGNMKDERPDKEGKVFQGVRCSSFAGFVLDDDTWLDAVREEDGTTRFRAEDGKGICNKNNPCSYDDPMALTPRQRRGAIMFFFKDVSAFDLTFAVNEVDPDLPDEKTLLMLFTGKSSLANKCAP